MNEEKIVPFHKACIDEREIEEVMDTLKSGWITMGPKTMRFEEEFKDYIKSEYAVSLNSATAALHLSLKALGLNKNDEVIIPTNTFVATAEVVAYFGAKPVLCDIEYDTHNIDVLKLESLINKNTKVIIPVHFAGQPCDMDEIHSLAKKYGKIYNRRIYVVEDAAHALPSKYKGNYIGTISDFTCFSFYATKTLATGEGGMVTTNSEEFAKQIKINRLHGISKDVWDRYKGGGWFYDVVDCGNKYNMTDLSASLGIIQLKKLETMNERRKKIAQMYDKAFRGKIKSVIIKPDRESSYHLYVIKVSNRDELYDKLKSEGIYTSVHFIPIHFHTYYRENFLYQKEDYPIANSVFEESLSLPIYPDMSHTDVSIVIEQVLKYAK